MSPKIEVVTGAKAKKRGLRKPQHPFHIQQRAWGITPFHIQPVLPGETLTSLNMMSRIVSDPLKNKLMGYWAEYYFFYVKHTDLDIASDLIEMHLDQNKDMSPHHAGDSSAYFHTGGGINYIHRCLQSVTEWYFRDEGADWQANRAGSLPAAKLNHEGWWNSIKKASEMPEADHELAGDNPVLPDNAPEGTDGRYEQWKMMRAARMTEATFEDYLKSFGVSVASEHDEEKKRPELLRYMKDFTYPTNTVEPSTGVPTSAATWSIAESIDKNYFFKEPGFIFGVSVVRPKVHLNNIEGTMTSFMDKSFDWLPAVLQDMPFTAVKNFQSGKGPAPVNFGEDYWVDLRDLFIYGEQYRNTDDHNGVAMPRSSGDAEFPLDSDGDALWVNANDNKRYFRSDGIVTSQIQSQVYKDYT